MESCTVNTSFQLRILRSY